MDDDLWPPDLRITRLVALLIEGGGSYYDADGYRPRRRRLTCGEIRQALPCYQFPPDDEKKEKARREVFQRDIRQLMERGFVRRLSRDSPGADAIDAAHGDSDTIELLMPEKPERLFLTPEEHKALASTRMTLHPDHAPPIISAYRLRAPFDPTVNRSEQAMDVASAVLRYLEEVGGTVTCHQVEAELARLGIPEPRTLARAAMKSLDFLEESLFVSGRPLGIEFESSLSRSEGARPGRPVVVAVSVPGPSRQTANRRSASGGLNSVNRPAYTPAEVEERLDLIERALEPDSVVSEEDRGPLRSARTKLEAWGQELDRLLP